MKTQLILIGVICIICFGIGFYVGRGQFTTNVPEIKYLNKYVPEPFKNKYSLPTKEFVYLPYLITSKELRVDTIYIPRTLKEYVLLPNNGISLSPNTVKVRVYDTVNRRYTDRLYEVPSYTFRHTITLGFNYFIRENIQYGWGEYTFWYKNFGLSGGLVLPFQSTPTYTVGLKYQLNF